MRYTYKTKREKEKEVLKMIRTGNYMIYKMYCKELNDMVTLFFLPENSLRRLYERQVTIASYKDVGYKVAGILYVDRESYLNARLTDTVEEYLDNDIEEQLVKEDYRFGKITCEVALQKLELIQDYKWTLLKKIHKQVNRLISEDFVVENEVALMLNDEYLKAIL